MLVLVKYRFLIHSLSKKNGFLLVTVPLVKIVITHEPKISILPKPTNILQQMMSYRFGAVNDFH